MNQGSGQYQMNIHPPSQSGTAPGNTSQMPLTEPSVSLWEPCAVGQTC